MLCKAHVDECPFNLHDRLVCHKGRGGGARIAIPFDEYLHNDLTAFHHATPLEGQLGFFCPLNSLCDQYWWVGMGNDVEWFI